MPRRLPRREVQQQLKAAIRALALLLAAPAFAQELRFDSCAGGPGLVVGAAEPRTLLSGDEIAQVGAALVERYPPLARGGWFPPQQIVLWQRAGRWIYVLLNDNPDGGGAPCFSATVDAATLATTPALLRRYFSNV